VTHAPDAARAGRVGTLSLEWRTDVTEMNSAGSLIDSNREGRQCYGKHPF
jgi:hypothetical protein